MGMLEAERRSSLEVGMDEMTPLRYVEQGGRWVLGQ